ncbi:MAG: A/G-specific adenine glycosylase [Neisseriaceae bacterium]|nr:A/G-specific adenine glycosylase [Neisseriaceae bacterium]
MPTRLPKEGQFAPLLIEWQRQHGRSGLPWQTKNPYQIWVSEIMLQQTQVSTVLNFYQPFLERFPTVEALSTADLDAVLALWSGLGYYSRARNLHHAAQQITTQFGGEFPQTRTHLERLAGVGRSTAAAIAVFAFGATETILDGNVKRVLTRVFGISGLVNLTSTIKQLWDLAESLLPQKASHAQLIRYTQGLMDLGATVCLRSKPLCSICPMSGLCTAFLEGKITELPNKAPSKTKPTRYVTVLLLQMNGAILLEKRPETGIWGGLWSLPENVSDDPNWQEGDLKIDDFKHTFTHYHLIITPKHRLTDSYKTLENQCFFTFNEALSMGIPQPVRLLLTQLAT